MGRLPPGWVDSATSEEVLHLLKNDTRREIVREIYRTYDRSSEDPGISFSELYSHVDCPDRGTFNYHLTELHGVFITQTDGRYAPIVGRQKALHELLAWLEMDHEQQGPVETEHVCPECGAQMSATYEQCRLTLSCRNHEDMVPTVWAPVPPGCIREQSLKELADLLPHFQNQWLSRVLAGLCPMCYAPIHVSPLVIRDGGQTIVPVSKVDSSDGRIAFGFDCQQCEVQSAIRVADITLQHPNGQSFLRKRDLDPRHDPLAHLLPTAVAPHVDTGTIASRDPVRLETTLTVAGDSCTFTIDGSGAVLAIE